MPTRFSKFLAGTHFPKVFLILYILFMVFSAYETGLAISCFVNGKYIFGAVYIIFALIAFAANPRKRLNGKPNHKIRKSQSFLRCYLIYYSIVLPLWIIVCLIFGFSDKIKSIGTLLTILVSALIVVFGYLNTKRIRIKRYSLSIQSGKSKYLMALISDIHLGVFVGEKHIKRMVKKINTLNLDALMISGDIFDADNSMVDNPEKLKAISKLLRKIKTKDGVFAVAGNHDPSVKNNEFIHFLKSAKISLLDNDVKILKNFNVVGRTDGANNERANICDVLVKADNEKPIIVLDHKPENISDAADHNADLVLCGHTHRGQMFPITIFTKMANGRKYFYGHSITDKTHSIITSGVGFFELPLRVGTSNEIALIELKI